MKRPAEAPFGMLISPTILASLSLFCFFPEHLIAIDFAAVLTCDRANVTYVKCSV